MPCFSTGIPVINDAIVGSLSAGFTAVADQVTAPSLINRLRVGIVPPFKEPWPNPSRTKRMTCSVGAIKSGAGAVPAATAPSLGRTRQRKKRERTSIRIDNLRSRLNNLCTDQFFLFCSKGAPTLSWRFPPWQASQGLASKIYLISCGLNGSWHSSDDGVMLIHNFLAVIKSAPGVSPEGEGDAIDPASTYYRPTDSLSNSTAETRPPGTAHHSIYVAHDYSGRSPGCDRSG